VPQEAGPSAFLTAEANRAVEQARGEPLEADWHLAQLPTEPLHHSADHATADQSLADGGLRRPVGAMHEQGTDGASQGRVGVNEPALLSPTVLPRGARGPLSSPFPRGGGE